MPDTFLGVPLGDTDPRLLTALFVVLGYMMLFWLAALALDWLWRKVRPRKPAKEPAPPRTVVETAQLQECTLNYKLGDLRLSWSFDSEAERDQFRIGFREGLEYQLEALKQRNALPATFIMEYGRVEKPNRHEGQRRNSGPPKRPLGS